MTPRPHPLPVEVRHDIGDHRHCEATRCQWARDVRPHGLAAGRAALERTGRTYAVVCIACGLDDDDAMPRLLATCHDLWSAKGSRNSHTKRGPHGNMYDHPLPHMSKSIVLVVGIENEEPALF